MASAMELEALDEDGNPKVDEAKKDDLASQLEAGDEKEKEVEKVDEVEKKDEILSVTTEEETRTLRQHTRELKRELDKVTGQLADVNKTLQDANLKPEVDKAEQDRINSLVAIRNEHLNNLLETMEVNPKFEDVRDVVSQANFDDMVEAWAQSYVEKNGGEINQVIQSMTREIWALPNPYKYMYTQIKQFHPNFKKDEEGKDVSSDKAKEVKPKIPGTIHDLPGGGGKNDGSRWTAKMIDEMEETELDKVPPDIYDKYLKNQLA